MTFLDLAASCLSGTYHLAKRSNASPRLTDGPEWRARQTQEIMHFRNLIGCLTSKKLQDREGHRRRALGVIFLRRITNQ